MTVQIQTEEFGDDKISNAIFYILITIQYIFTDSRSIFKELNNGIYNQSITINFDDITSLTNLEKKFQNYILKIFAFGEESDDLVKKYTLKNIGQGLRNISNIQLIQEIKGNPLKVKNIYIFLFIFGYIFNVSRSDKKNGLRYISLITKRIMEELNIKEDEFKPIFSDALTEINNQVISYYRKYKLNKIPDNDIFVPLVNFSYLTELIKNITNNTLYIFATKNKLLSLNQTIISDEKSLEMISLEMKNQRYVLRLISALYYFGSKKFLSRTQDAELGGTNQNYSALKILLNEHAEINERQKNPEQFREIFPEEYFIIKLNDLTFDDSFITLNFAALFALTKKIILTFAEKRHQTRFTRWREGYQSGNMTEIFHAFMKKFSPQFFSLIGYTDEDDAIKIHSSFESNLKDTIKTHKTETDALTKTIKMKETELKTTVFEYSDEVQKYFKAVEWTVYHAIQENEKEKLDKAKLESLKRQEQGQREFAAQKAKLILEQPVSLSKGNNKFVLNDSTIPNLLSTIKMADEPHYLASLNDCLFHGDFWIPKGHSSWWVIQGDTPSRGRETVALIQWYISFRILTIYYEIQRKNKLKDDVLKEYSKFIAANQFIKYEHYSRIFDPKISDEWKQFNLAYTNNFENCAKALGGINKELGGYLRNKFDFNISIKAG